MRIIWNTGGLRNPYLPISVQFSGPRMKASHGSVMALQSFTTQQGEGSCAAVREAKLFLCSKPSCCSICLGEGWDVSTIISKVFSLAFFPSPEDKMALPYSFSSWQAHTSLSEPKLFSSLLPGVLALANLIRLCSVLTKMPASGYISLMSLF